MTEKIKNILKEAIISKINEGSPASEKAKQMGLKYLGYGKYTDGKITYFSDGENIYPLEGSSKKKSTKRSSNYYELFAKKINAVSQEDPSTEVILDAMVKSLPSKEAGENLGNKETLEKILNKCIPMFEDIVKDCLKNSKFRTILLKKYLEKFNQIEQNQEL